MVNLYAALSIVSMIGSLVVYLIERNVYESRSRRFILHYPPDIKAVRRALIAFIVIFILNIIGAVLFYFYGGH